MGRVGQILSHFLIFGAAVLGGCRASHPPSVDEMKDISDEQPTLVMEQVRVQTFGPDGLEWELVAPLARTFSRKDMVLVNDLKVNLFEESKPSSTIQADEGIMRSDSGASSSELSVQGVSLSTGDMFLNGHVVVVSTDGHTLQTDWLYFNKKADLITSSAPVRVERSDYITEGIGMKAKPDFSSLEIFDQTVLMKDQGQSTQ